MLLMKFLFMIINASPALAESFVAVKSGIVVSASVTVKAL